MRSLGFSRYALTMGAAAAILAGCGGSQPPIGATGAMTAATARQGRSHRRVMRQFLYLAEHKLVSSGFAYQTSIVSYPDGHDVANIANFGQMCRDSSGDVYIDNGSAISEYSPGGANPIAQVALPNEVYGSGCAVDPITGNIAVGGAQLESSKPVGWLGVYPTLNGSPSIYTSPFMQNFIYCGYDDEGNLFLSGYHDYGTWLNELPKDQNQFTILSAPHGPTFGPIQWDGQYITIENAWKGLRHSSRMAIYRLTVAGSSVNVVGKTPLDSPNGPDEAQFSWIQGNTVVKPYGSTSHNDEVGLWHYPRGGRKPYKVLTGFEYVDYPLISTSYAK